MPITVNVTQGRLQRYHALYYLPAGSDITVYTCTEISYYHPGLSCIPPNVWAPKIDHPEVLYSITRGVLRVVDSLYVTVAMMKECRILENVYWTVRSWL